jgi:argininosuccinate lyase
MTDLVAGGLEVNASRMREAAAEGHATATDLADLSRPQRRAVPRRARSRRARGAPRGADGVELSALPLAELQSFAPQIAADVHEVLTLEGSVASRNHPGGTAPEQVRAAIAAARRALDAKQG